MLTIGRGTALGGQPSVVCHVGQHLALQAARGVLDPLGLRDALRRAALADVVERHVARLHVHRLLGVLDVELQ